LIETSLALRPDPPGEAGAEHPAIHASESVAMASLYAERKLRRSGY
jgi:hypothetical protein